MIWTSPRSGKADFIAAVIRRLIKNDYTAIDSGGNALSLQAWIAEKSKGKNTKIITELVGGGIKSYKRAKEEAPVLAFYQETKIRRMINITENEQIRARD